MSSMRQPEFLREDLPEHRVGALADVRGHGQQVHRAVGEGAHLGALKGYWVLNQLKTPPEMKL